MNKIHQAYLTEHITMFDAWRLDQAPRMPGSPHFHLMNGLVTGQVQGFGLMYSNVQQQASLLAYNDIYRMLAMTAMVFIPAFVLLKKAGGKAPAAH